MAQDRITNAVFAVLQNSFSKSRKQGNSRTRANLSPSFLRGRGFNVPGSILKRSPTNYAVKVYVGDGKYKWYSGFQSRREAEAFQVSLASHPAHAAGLGLYGSSRERLRSYAEQWLGQQKIKLRPKTLDTYRTLLKHIIGSIGWMPIAKVGPRTLDEFYTKLLDRGLSPTTVRHVATLLHTIFADAVRQEIVSQNPCEYAEPPSRRRGAMRVLDEEQVRLFLGEAKKSSPHYALYLAAVTTGMRQGELLGLRWQDVNLTLGVVMVQQTFYRLGGQKLFGEPKTAKARRTVPLLPVLIEELRALREKQAEDRRLFGEKYQDHGLVFCQRSGRPEHAHNIVRRDFHKVLERAKLPRIRFHDLRHCHATLLLVQGTHPKVVQERLGHSAIGITLDTYSHVLPGLQEQAVRHLQERLFGTAPELHLNCT